MSQSSQSNPNQVKRCGLVALCVVFALVTGCGGGGVSVNYAPVAACSDVDLSPVDCNR